MGEEEEREGAEREKGRKGRRDIEAPKKKKKNAGQAGTSDESRLEGPSLNCFSEQTRLHSPHMDVKDSSAQMTWAVSHKKRFALFAL